MGVSKYAKGDKNKKPLFWKNRRHAIAISGRLLSQLEGVSIQGDVDVEETAPLFLLYNKVCVTTRLSAQWISTGAKLTLLASSNRSSSLVTLFFLNALCGRRTLNPKGDRGVSLRAVVCVSALRGICRRVTQKKGGFTVYYTH